MKKKLVTMLMMVTVVTTMLAGCNNKIDDELTEHEDATDCESFQEDIEVKEDHNYKHVMNMIDSLYGTENENVILSETSLDMALGMVMQGATNDAASELEAYYGVTPTDKLYRDHSLIELYNNRDDVTLNIANAVYSNNNVVLNGDFISNVSDGYYAAVDNLDFNDAASADVINNWCSEKTNDLINQIVTPEQLQAKDSIILNALYFNGTWGDEFEDCQLEDIDFTNVGNGTSTVTGMYESGLSTYYETDTATGFAKYYEGNEIAFIGILPNEEILDKNKDFKMTDIDLQEFLESETYEYDVDIMIPKFKVEDSNSLNDVLKEEGLNSMFLPGNLGGINPDLLVSDVIQKTVVDVNETGTEAAAVTEFGINFTCSNPAEIQKKEVILDRPFAFMIYDTVNNEILFVGKIVEL